MPGSELEIVSVWSIPQSNAYFTQRGQIYVQVRNSSTHDIELERVECVFKNDEDLEPYIPTAEWVLNLEADELSPPLFIDFQFDLALKADTNRYLIKIYHSSGKVLEHDPRQYIVIFPICPPKKEFFISHKDPADTAISKRLAGFLFKLGLVGYVAEDDIMLGIDLWEEKIIPAIKRSIGTIILFTASAESDPDRIVREIKLSKENDKPLILVLEPGVGELANPPKGIEHYRLKTPINSNAVKEIAGWVYDMYRKGKYNPKRNP